MQAVVQSFCARTIDKRFTWRMCSECGTLSSSCTEHCARGTVSTSGVVCITCGRAVSTSLVSGGLRVQCTELLVFSSVPLPPPNPRSLGLLLQSMDSPLWIDWAWKIGQSPLLKTLISNSRTLSFSTEMPDVSLSYTLSALLLKWVKCLKHIRLPLCLCWTPEALEGQQLFTWEMGTQRNE